MCARRSAPWIQTERCAVNNKVNKPAVIPDPDVLPDDMDLDDRVSSAAEAEPEPEPEEAKKERAPQPADIDIAAAQRPPSDS